MPATRRRVLGSLAVGLAAAATGCSALDGGPDTSPPSQGECPASPRVPNAEPPVDGAELPPIPNPPGSLGEKSVVAYVEDYEFAFIWRRSVVRHGGVTDINRVEATDSRAVDGGVVVTFRSILPSGQFVDEGNEYTFDAPRYSASYLVTDEAVWRAQSEPSDQPPEPPAPREAGALLECF